MILTGIDPQVARSPRCSLAALAAVCVLLCGPSFAVSSYAFVTDDGSLRISGRTYRLYGIYIPPTEQACRTFERPLTCASRAALALDFKISANFVRCEPREKNDDGTISAYCTVNGDDLAAYMLERGWALSLPGAPFEYQALEKIARHRGLGVWGFAVEKRP